MTHPDFAKMDQDGVNRTLIARWLYGRGPTCQWSLTCREAAIGYRRAGGWLTVCREHYTGSDR